MKEDRFTNTEDDAGRFEAVHGDADAHDDRPTNRELREDADWTWDPDGAE